MMGTELQPLARKLSRRDHSRPAAYALVQQDTGLTYVGSTGNLYERVVSHFGRLAAGEHANPRLQAAFNADPRFSLSVRSTETREEALDIEQTLLDTIPENPLMLNVATDARASWLNRRLTDEERQQRSISGKRRYEDPTEREAQRAIATARWQDPAYRDAHRKAVSTPEAIEQRTATSTELWKDPNYRAKLADYYQSDEAKVHAAAVGARSSKPVTVDDVSYPSIAEAAKVLGIKPGTLSARLRRK